MLQEAGWPAGAVRTAAGPPTRISRARGRSEFKLRADTAPGKLRTAWTGPCGVPGPPCCRRVRSASAASIGLTRSHGVVRREPELPPASRADLESESRREPESRYWHSRDWHGSLAVTSLSRHSGSGPQADFASAKIFGCFGSIQKQTRTTASHRNGSVNPKPYLSLSPRQSCAPRTLQVSTLCCTCSAVVVDRRRAASESRCRLVSSCLS